MKNIYNLFALLLFTFCVVACDGNDDYVYKVPDSLEVISSNLYFKSAGGSSNIEMHDSANLIATSSVDWCTLIVSDNIVKVTVTENGSKESRDGLVMISNGKLKSQLTLHQEGLAIDFDTEDFNGTFSNIGGTTSFIVSSTSPYVVNVSETAKSWLSYVDEDGKLTFMAAKNETGAPRAAEVALVSGSVTKTFFFSQYEKEDLIGTWTAEYTNSDGMDLVATVILEKDNEGNLMLNFPVESVGTTYTFPCDFSNGYLNIKTASALGMYANTYYLYSVVLSKDGSLSWDAGLSYGGTGAVDTEGNFMLRFGDNGTWSGQVITGLAIWAFDSSTLSSDSSVGYLDQVYDLILYR